MIFIGIDPGRNTGVAIWDGPRQQFNKLTTLDFWGVIELIDRYKKVGTDYFKIVIENPGLNKPTFARKGESVKLAMNRSQKVGRNKEQAYLIIGYCKLHKIDFTEVRPTQTKWNADPFRRLTKYRGSTNEHNRDAARLVWKLK